MRTALCRLAAAALMLVAAGEAVAAVPAGFPAGTTDRFAPAGDRVLLWSSDGRELSLREPDGTVRVLHRAVQRSGSTSVIAEVAATPTQVAFVTESFDWDDESGAVWSSLRAGPLGGPYRLVAGRERDGGRVQPRDVAIADAGLLFSDDDGVMLRPADGGAPVRLGGTGRGERLAVNGRYAAARSSSHVAVYDLEARRAVARLAVDTGFRDGLTDSVGVSADGAVAFVDEERRLWAFNPTTGQRTLLMRGADGVARVAGSTVYAVRWGSGSYDDALQRLWAVDLRGGAPRPLTEAVFGGEFVTDGTRLLYARDGCILHGDLSVQERAPVTPDCPRQSLDFSVAEEHRRPRVPMQVICPGTTADRCTGTARLTAPRAGGRGRVVLGTWRFVAAGGRTVRHTLAVRPDGAAATRRRGRSRITARLRITGSPYGSFTRRIVFDLGG